MTRILDELRSLPTDRKTLRRFGIMIGAILCVGAALYGWRVAWSAGTTITLSTGGLLVILGLLSPLALLGPYRAWMLLALAMGFVMTRVILTVVFVVIVTPIGLVMRLLRKDPMNRAPDPAASTYWIKTEKKDNVPASLERYY